MIARAAAAGLVREAGGAALFERLVHLERLREGRANLVVESPVAPDPAASADFDVAVVGGGLWSILAPVLASRGLRVAVLDRARVAETHREWNASEEELGALASVGLVTPQELEALIVARYRGGTCRFHGGGAYEVEGVLDRAVDAGQLLSLARTRGEALGVTYLDGHSVIGHTSGADAVVVRAIAGGVARDLVARVMVEARGVASPYAAADLVCPTVGGVMEGLAEGRGADEVDPTCGEILATVDGIEEGRQHVWEGFPGRPGETTVYLFYYARSGEPVSLLDLYARFFATLPTYKRGAARLVRPTFGLIPGWSRLTPPPSPPRGRVILVGDAAARHSPLTYCGFGATLRSLRFAADAVARMVDERQSSAPTSVVHDAPIHALTGALAHMMASRAFAGGELNSLLDAAFRTLHAMGNASYAALLRDEMSTVEFATFLRRTAALHPSVWGKVARGLGVSAAGRWGLSVARSMWGA